MPQVVVAAVVGAAASTAVGVVVGTVAKTAIMTAFAKTFVTSLVLGAVSQALAKKPSAPTLTQRDQTVTVRQPVAPHQIIYGRTRVGGTMVFLESTQSNKFLHIVVALAGHEIDAVEKVYFDDQEVILDGNGIGFGGKARVQYKLGATDQTAFADLVAESGGLWTTNHRLRGIACAYVRLEYDQDRFPNGVPNFSFLIRGKKVFDPRTSTTVWSSNAALCLSDYLTSTTYGLSAVYANEIDSAALIAAANVCDEDINLAGGGTENRYECHGVFDSAQRPEDVINGILSAMAGKAVWSSGKWRIIPGVYYTPTLTFDENDLRGGIRVQSLVSRRENFNCIKGIFSSAPDNYIKADFPSLVSQTFIAQDNGEQVFKNIELPFTTSASMAQRLAKVELLKARQQITVSMPMKLNGLKANVGDIVQINNTRMGWSAKRFEVVSLNMVLEEALGVDFELREISTDVFDWSTSEEQAYDPAPNTNLPNAFTVQNVEGLSATSGESTVLLTGDGTVIARILATWTLPADQFVSSGGQVEVGFKRQSETIYTTIFVDGLSNSVYLSPVKEGVTYDIRARFINALGVKGAFSNTTNLVVGDQIAPAAVTGFAVAPENQRLRLSWNQNIESDLAFYEIRTSDSGWGGAGALFKGLATSVLVTPPALGVATTYYIKAADFSLNYSTVASASYTVQAPIDITSLNETFSDTALTNATVNFDWSDATPIFGLDFYEVSYNSVVKKIKASSIILPGDWIGSRTFTVKVIDLLGNKSAGFSKSITKLVPNPVTNLRAQVIDNNVLLFWNLPARTTLPIQHVRLKKGTTWDSASLIGIKDGGFTSLQELVAGTYRYWVAVVDTDGYESTPVSVTAQVSAPPDFIFFAEYDSLLDGTKSSAYSEADGILLPVDTTETWEDHFITRSWNTPQDQINAGFPIYIQPADDSGFYEETIDYGTTLASSKITVGLSGIVVSGDPAIVVTISTSPDNITYTDYPDTTAIYATNFRYFKVKVAVSSTGNDDLYKITGIEVILDAKLKNDAGTITASASDSGGTQVNFTIPFIDITSLDATPRGTTPITAVIDFVDVPNPTGFKVFLFDGSGNRVSGDVSWSAKGY